MRMLVLYLLFHRKREGKVGEYTTRKLMLFALALGIALLGVRVRTAKADNTSGSVFFTTFNGGTNVWTDTYNFNGTTFTLGTPTGIAATNGADGLLFAPDGNLIIAGQGTDLLHEITTGGVPVNTVDAGTGAYHLGLSGTGTTLYTMWNGPGSGGSTAIAATVLSGGGLAVAGTPYTVSCAVGTTCITDVRGVVFDPVNGKWYYSTAGDGVSGTFGTVVFNDVTHTATLTQLLSGVFAHGVSFDPFTKDIIMNSGGEIEQFDPVSGTIVSTLSGLGPFDQAAEDGKGHLFVAANSGFLEFVDYDKTGLIGAPGNFTAEPFLIANLDDIAPLSGAGSTPVPEPSSLMLMGLGLLGLLGMARRRLVRLPT
jgi:hypothetical protein